MTYVLGVFKCSWDDVTALIGENCATNKSNANMACIPLIGCASHRFNSAVQRIMGKEEELLEKINRLMSKLKTLLLGAKLLQLTPLRPITRDTTRWSSTFDIISRYVRLREFLVDLGSSDTDDLCLNSSENRRVDSLPVRLKDLESVSKSLQKESATIAEVRVLFDAVMDQYPETASKLSPSAAIVHSPYLESAIVKLQLGSPNDLSEEEKACLKAICVDEGADQDSASEALSVAERALKKQKIICGTSP